jgi:hypothetical protein
MEILFAFGMIFVGLTVLAVCAFAAGTAGPAGAAETDQKLPPS